MRKKTVRIVAYGMVVLMGIILGGSIYYMYDPVSSPFFPKCPFLLATGLKCPGCGSQRAIHALLHLNIGSAFAYNTLLVCSIPYLLLLVAGRAIQFFRLSATFYARIQRPAVIWSYLALVIVFWMTRNLFGF
jgi:hypothetical protein